jgi:hypothetical protein
MLPRQAIRRSDLKMTDEPLKIVGIDVANVGKPDNDGTLGSGLYRVPLKLNRAPGADWAHVFPEVWNQPPHSTTMHRSGIAHVSGSSIVLDGTTVDEVEQYHLETLRHVFLEVNRRVSEIEARRKTENERQENATRDHEAHVRDVADRIKFD